MVAAGNNVIEKPLARGPGGVLWFILALSLSIHVLCLVAGKTWLHGWSWPHEPFHATVEMAGGIIALGVAWMLLSLERLRAGTSYNVWIAAALVGMGILDSLHAMVYVGQAFVWLHSTATLVGGLLFALVWLPAHWQRNARRWPWLVTCAVLVFGAVSLLWPDQMPRMVTDNKLFTPWAKGLNIVGGVLLFIAAIRLVLTYRQTKNIDDLLFCLHCSLFGAAAIMFEQSQLWDLPWWGWHLLRLMAYGVALWFVVETDLAMAKKLQEQQTIALAQSMRELEFAYAAVPGTVKRELIQSTIDGETDAELVGIDNFDDAMDLWARQARTAIGAHQSAVSYIPGGVFKVAKHAVSLSDKYEKYRTYDVLPTGEGIWAVVAREHQSFCLTDDELKSHPAWRNFSDIRDERGLEHPPMRGWLAVPILSGKREFVGVLQLSDKYEGDFTEQELNYLTRLASLMAPAFSLQYAYEETQRRSEELARAKESLERSNADLQQFAYVASHDLQEPLRAVAGYCQLLETKLSDSPDEDVQTFLRHATEGAKRMQALINSLLDFARIETRGKDFTRVDLNEALSEALSNLQVAIQESAATVTADGMPNVLGDRDQLVRLFQNLISNAIKFRGNEAPRIRVEVEENSDNWQFSVRDNGIGLEQQYADRIFIIFQRLHTRDKYAGTGLGLAITKRIVERHGGRIWVESKPGEGSAFFFTLPRNASE